MTTLFLSHLPPPCSDQLSASKPRLTWVTDMVVMPNTNKVILSFTDNVISVYDLTTTTDEGQFQIVAFPYCILVMDYW